MCEDYSKRSSCVYSMLNIHWNLFEPNENRMLLPITWHELLWPQLVCVRPHLVWFCRWTSTSSVDVNIVLVLLEHSIVAILTWDIWMTWRARNLISDSEPSTSLKVWRCSVPEDQRWTEHKRRGCWLAAGAIDCTGNLCEKEEDWSTHGVYAKFDSVGPNRRGHVLDAATHHQHCADHTGRCEGEERTDDERDEKRSPSREGELFEACQQFHRCTHQRQRQSENCTICSLRQEGWTALTEDHLDWLWNLVLLIKFKLQHALDWQEAYWTARMTETCMG